MTKMSIEFVGLNALQQKLVPKWLYWQIVKKALDGLGKEAASEAGRSAPRLSGALSAGMTHRVNAIPVPLWVVVTTGKGLVGKSGGRYPWILEFGAKWGHKNWLRDAIRRAQAASTKFASSAAGQVQSKWNS